MAANRKRKPGSMEAGSALGDIWTEYLAKALEPSGTR
jgi:hypothetical protein